ncbi:MAG: hypothetical protein GX446_13745 [Chthonomonadales bacterium]|nr:hypothetical protein [Chthonomonadales bacterium]
MNDGGCLALTVGEPGRRVELRDLQSVSEAVGGALRALAREMGRFAPSALRLEIVGARPGSLVLDIQAVIEDEASDAGDRLLETFAGDMDGIVHNRFRTDMSTTLLSRYRRLIQAPSGTTPVRIIYRNTVVQLDAATRSGAELALRHTVAPGVTVVGTIEVVNVHKRPLTLSLYTKLEPRDRILCQFRADDLPDVVRCLQDRTLVRIRGTGSYGPVGLHPLDIEMDGPPEPVDYQPRALAAFVGRYDLVPRGMRAEEYVAELRDRAYAEG